MSNVFQIGDLKFTRQRDRRYGKPGECMHKNLELDEKGDVVLCLDCKIQVSAFWALTMLTHEMELAATKMDAERQLLAKDLDTNRHLRATRRVEEAWRSRSMVPTCPHCGEGISANDGFGSSFISKEVHLRRLAVREEQNKLKSQNEQ